MTDLTTRSAAHAHGGGSRMAAAPGIEAHDVKPVNAKAERGLYASRQKIYAKRARGRYRSVKWLLMAVTLGVYYVLPWLKWHRGASLPDQAVLLDFPNRRFFFFFLEIWPQEFYFVTGLLVLAALALFLVTAIAGRVWCGYFCPQTVWTDMMIAAERFWQGDRNARMLLDKQRWGPAKLYKKSMTHLTFLLISLLTGGAFVLYFDEAPRLTRQLLTGEAPAIAYLFIGIFTITTYLLGGIAREQVCTYMCPWPRIQGALLDADSYLVTYKPHRGEPRGHLRKAASPERRGDCIDCKACVVVCPMGIDIRNGPQLECIQCALCVDACNDIMAKIGRPPGLIDYDTFHNLEAAEHKQKQPRIRIVRPRTVLYAALFCVVGLVMLWGVSRRTTLELNVLPDRNPLFVQLSDGGFRNGYTVKILNKRYDTRHFSIGVAGLDGASIKIVGMESDANPVIPVAADTLRELRVFVSVPKRAADQIAAGSTPIVFQISDRQDATRTSRDSQFRKP